MKGTAIEWLLSQVRNSQTALTGGSVTFYSAGTSQLKSVFLDRDMTIQAANPYNLDATATAALFGIGLYRMLVKDVHGATVFDRDNIYIGVDPDNLPVATPPAQPNKNLSNNGGFYMWTLGQTRTRSTITDYETANGWFWTSDGSVAGTGVATRSAFSAGQTAVPDNPVAYVNLNRTVAVSGGASYERYVNRLPDVGRMSGQQVNIAIWTKATAGSVNASIFIRQDFGSGGSTSPTPITSSITIPVGVWTKFTYNLTIPSVSGKTIGTNSYTEIGLALPVGTLFNVDLSHVQIEFGAAETQYEYLRGGEDYARTVGLDSGNVTFNTVTLSQADGIAPLVTSSQTKVINLNADKLDDQHATWYMPPGAVMPFAMNSAPSGWLKCNGQAISRTGIYTALFANVGTTYGVGDGSTTFNLPDLRGVFVRGWADDGATYDAARAFNATVQTDGNKSHSHISPVHNHTKTDPGHLHANGATVDGSGTVPGASFVRNGGNTGTSTTGITLADTAVTINADGIAETRPVNVALLYCIKY